MGLVTTLSSAQDFKQTIRGTVTDAQSEVTIVGAAVTLNPQDSLPKRVLTDVNGKFRFDNVPIGRHTLHIEMISYDPALLENLEVTSSKELVLNVSLQEQVNMQEEFVITADDDKTQANNEMATVSARILSIDESKRYAGSLNDVSRMAQNFAGVRGSDDSRNDIVIRGNSPIGVLYRMEGIDIPNPNHFAAEGTTGGPVSMLNNNVLANSDFLTGAFPAEYGNATSGVFDLKLRSGNNEKHEFLGQMGFNGLEFMAEGPLSKNHKASYLISYRYSTLELFQKIGFEFGTASIPEYQDMTFRLNFPSKNGSTQIFGMGGISQIEFLDSETDSTDLFAFGGFDTRFKSRVGVLGFKHTRFLSKSAYVKVILGMTGHSTFIENDSVSVTDKTPIAYYRNNSATVKQTLNVYFNQKISAKHTIRVGAITDRYVFNLSDSAYTNPGQPFFVISDFDGDTWLVRAYAQWQFRPTNKITFNTGIHNQFLTLNNTISPEPRVGMRYQLNRINALSVGYGLHSSLVPFRVYFENVETSNGSVRPNQDLGFSKAHHFVLGYDRVLGDNKRIKAEVYYQSLFDVPVNAQPSSYSMLNQGAAFGVAFPDSLENSGTGWNTGFELTFEKFLDRGLYYLLTVSLYESRYKGSNGIEYNTAFNGNYTFNLIGGKEFEIAKNKKNKKRQSLLSASARVTWQGGQRFTPILLEESIAAGEAVYDFDNAFRDRYEDYFRADLRIGIKVNGKKTTQEWAVDLQNVTNRQNLFRQEFNSSTGKIDKVFQIGLLPIALYKITF